MSALKARNITEVQFVDGEWQASVEGVWELVRNLPRPDLLRAAKLAFPATPGNRWFKVPSHNIVTAIETGSVPASVVDGAVEGPTDKQVAYATKLGIELRRSVPTFSTKDEASEWIDAAVIDRDAAKAAVSASTTTTAPAPAPNSTEAAALQALRDLLGGHGTATVEVDEATVRRIVQEEVAKASEPRRIVVEAGGVQRDIEGATHCEFDTVVALSNRCNVLLVGEAGSGKSTLALQAFHAFGLEHRSISVGPTTPTSKFFGYKDANGNDVRTPLWDAYEYGHGFLVDEVDNGHPGLLAELNQLLANGEAAFAGGQVKRHDNFKLIATANTFGRGGDRLFVGRNVLDAAFLDRFATWEVNVDPKLELIAAKKVVNPEHDALVTAWVKRVQKVRANVAKHNLPIIVSPRASIEGSKLLADGLPEAIVAKAWLFKGTSDEHLKLIDA